MWPFVAFCRGRKQHLHTQQIDTRYLYSAPFPAETPQSLPPNRPADLGKVLQSRLPFFASSATTTDRNTFAALIIGNRPLSNGTVQRSATPGWDQGERSGRRGLDVSGANSDGDTLLCRAMTKITLHGRDRATNSCGPWGRTIRVP